MQMIRRQRKHFRFAAFSAWRKQVDDIADHCKGTVSKEPVRTAAFGRQMQNAKCKM
jgi:hypothetical protein